MLLRSSEYHSLLRLVKMSVCNRVASAVDGAQMDVARQTRAGTTSDPQSMKS
jgi:hypothetical protein